MNSTLDELEKFKKYLHQGFLQIYSIDLNYWRRISLKQRKVFLFFKVIKIKKNQNSIKIFYEKLKLTFNIANNLNFPKSDKFEKVNFLKINSYNRYIEYLFFIHIGN